MPDIQKDTKPAASAASASAAAPAPAAAPQPEKRAYVVRNRISGEVGGKRDPRRGDTLHLTDADAKALGTAVELAR